MKDLVERNGLYYKKFSDVPFTGKVTGNEQGAFKNGKEEGSWDRYWENGQLRRKGYYKNGKEKGSWVGYWESEHTNYSNEVSEMALAHAVSDKVEAAYRRGDLFEKRKQQMNDWAEFCDRVYDKSSGNVVPIKAGR